METLSGAISNFLVRDFPPAHPKGAVNDVAAHACKPQSADDRELIEQLRHGRREALDRIIREYEPRIAKLVSRLCGWSSESEDLVQEVFVKAMLSAKRFRGDAKVGTWLTQIAINTCRDHHRKRIFRRTFWKRWIQRSREQSQEPPHASIERNQRTRRVIDAVQRLKPADREVVVLRYLEEMDVPQIQQVLGQSRTAIEVRLHRARQMLAEMLGDEEGA